MTDEDAERVAEAVLRRARKAIDQRLIMFAAIYLLYRLAAWFWKL